VGGAELAQRAYQQAWVFGARFVLMREVAQLRVGAGPHVLRLADGREANARAVVLATGAAYRRLGVPSLEELVGAGVFYGGSLSEPHALAAEPVYVVGGGNSAGQAALGLARHAERVTIVVRGSSLDETMSRYLRDEIAATPNVVVRLRTEIADGGGAGRLEWLSLRDRDTGEASREAAAALFVLIGATPRTAWLPAAVARDPSGFVLTGADLSTEHARTRAIDRGPFPFETSVPGVFAVGDTRHGSVKRVASAVGEGSVAVQQIHEYLALAGRPAPVRS
jgi:thioredoxin reductase (NADPH)